jgi:hypothetical protein
MKHSRIASISALATVAAFGGAAYAGGGDVNYPANVAQPAAVRTTQSTGDFDGRLFSESGTVDTVLKRKLAPAANVATVPAATFMAQDFRKFYTRG